MEDAKSVESTSTAFKLSELSKLYADNLPTEEQQSRVNSNRFNERLLANSPNITVVTHDRDVLLTFKDTVGIALQQAADHSDSDAVYLIHTVSC